MNLCNLRRLAVPLGLALLLAAAFRTAGWPGVAAVGGGVLMWLLLHFTRLVAVVRRTADRPIGQVDSAVQFHARLHQGAPLLQVLALSRALGQPLTPPQVQPERFGWQDAGGVQVVCTFVHGRLACWQLLRPPAAGAPCDPPPQPSGGICPMDSLPP